MKDYDDQADVMTLPEVAQYLQLSEKTVLRMARRGEIPAAKIASQWRFIRTAVRDWVAGQMQSLVRPSVGGLTASRGTELSLREVVRPELMALSIKPGPKERVLRQIVEPLRRTGFARDASMLLQNLLARERMMTTAIGHGIAMPHPRRPIENMFPEPAVAVGICQKGTNFNAIDDQLVHVFFMICATRDEIHLQLMARVAWLARQEQAIAKLREVRSSHEVIEIISNHGRAEHASISQ